jgi:hypothetical protein
MNKSLNIVDINQFIDNKKVNPLQSTIKKKLMNLEKIKNEFLERNKRF